MLPYSIKNGKSLYEDFCVRCHMPNGKGQEGIIPPLAKSDFLFKHMEESIKALKFGALDYISKSDKLKTEGLLHILEVDKTIKEYVTKEYS